MVPKAIRTDDQPSRSRTSVWRLEGVKLCEGSEKNYFDSFRNEVSSRCKWKERKMEELASRTRSSKVVLRDERSEVFILVTSV